MDHSNKSAETVPVFHDVENAEMWNEDSSETDYENIFVVICFKLAIILFEVRWQDL